VIVEWPALGWVDLAMLIVVAFSAVVGLWRGFTFEVLSLAGWFFAYVAARALQPWAASELPIGEPGSLLNHGAAFACVFIVALIVWGFVARGISTLIKKTPLSPIDRLLGAGFGVLRAGVVLLVFATIIGYTPAARSPAWRQSSGAAILEAALQALLPLLPEGAVPPPGRAA
jgi:membrane protein required for colicin V production